MFEFPRNGILLREQRPLRIVLTWLTLTAKSLLSDLTSNADTPTLVPGESCLIWVTRLNVLSAITFGEELFMSFVPTWRISLSGIFLTSGLTKSSISLKLAPGKGFTTKWLVESFAPILLPITFLTMESPAITVTFFFVVCPAAEGCEGLTLGESFGRNRYIPIAVVASFPYLLFSWLSLYRTASSIKTSLILLFVFPGPVPLESTSVHPVANAGISLSTAQSVQLP